MARLVGVDLPRDKRIEVGLRYIFGIGPKIALDLVNQCRIVVGTRVKDLSEDELVRLREALGQHNVEGDLRRKVNQDVKRLMDIGSYRGLRHKRKLPVRGQRTHTNARTKKGKRVAIAGKKKVTK
jgi:small subunit ribosomal protein S13